MAFLAALITFCQTHDEMVVEFFDVAVRADLDKWKYFVRARDGEH